MSFETAAGLWLLIGLICVIMIAKTQDNSNKDDLLFSIFLIFFGPLNLLILLLIRSCRD